MNSEQIEQLLIAIAVTGGLAIVLALILSIADAKLKVKADERVEMIESLLPGYNCGACGYPGCAGLADAIVAKNGSENDCKPANEEQKSAIQKYKKEMNI